MGNIDSAAMGNPNSTHRWEIWKSRGLPVPAMWLVEPSQEVGRFEIGAPSRFDTASKSQM